MCSRVHCVSIWILSIGLVECSWLSSAVSSINFFNSECFGLFFCHVSMPSALSVFLFCRVALWLYLFFLPVHSFPFHSIALQITCMFVCLCLLTAHPHNMSQRMLNWFSLFGIRWVIEKKNERKKRTENKRRVDQLFEEHNDIRTEDEVKNKTDHTEHFWQRIYTNI